MESEISECLTKSPNLLTIQPQSINLSLVKEKHSSSIDIKVNEKEVSVPSKTTLLQLKKQFKPEGRCHHL